jgi:hypothetical protein
MRAHRQLEDKHRDKQRWPENIARFSTHEMAAAVHTIDVTMSQAYTPAYFFTSADEASKLQHKGSKGIAATPEPDGGLGVRVTLRSPAELGWEKNAGGRFLDTAGKLMFGKNWRETASKQLQAVLILGIPTDQLPDDDADTFVIPEGLLVEGGVAEDGKTSLVGDDSQLATAGTPYYSSAHVYKIYLVQRTTITDHCSAIDEEQDLQELFALVDANGDGKVTKEEATEYLRNERQVDLDDHSINTIWTVLDEDRSGDLDITEFPRFLEVVDKEIARVAADANTPATQQSVLQAVQKAASQVAGITGSSNVDATELQTVRATIDRMQAALPKVSLQTEVDLREELSGMRLKELQARMNTLGITQDQIDKAEEAVDVKAAFMGLIVSATPVASRHEDRTLSELCAILRIDHGALQDAIEMVRTRSSLDRRPPSLAKEPPPLPRSSTPPRAPRNTNSSISANWRDRSLSQALPAQTVRTSSARAGRTEASGGGSSMRSTTPPRELRP